MNQITQYKSKEIRQRARLEDKTTSAKATGNDSEKLELLRTKFALLKYYAEIRNWSDAYKSWLFDQGLSEWADD